MTGRRLSLEWLEPRWLLSGDSGAVPSATYPASADSLAQSPSSLAIDFNQNEVSGTWVPGDVKLTQSPSSLTINFDQDARDSGYWVDGLVQLESIGQNGSSPVPLGPATFDQLTGSIATIPVLATLGTGNYQVVLAGSEYYSSQFSYLLDPAVGNSSTNLLWDSSEPLTLADFSIVQTGAKLSDATYEGTIGTKVQSIKGSLDLSSQENVNLYEITLGPGHFWQLGVELDAQRIGSNLLGALTLFDSNGNVLATRDSGTGLPSSPDDPYIFTGLNPGVYYIGVSGAGNLAGQPGGYDPVTGTMGSAGQPQAGGAYDLQVVADPADSLTQVTGFSLQRADTLNSTPTGLTLTFSGAIDPNSLRPNSPVLVYDASGKAWPITLSSYAGSQVSFVFNQPLPPGQYTVVVPPSGGLADLIGRAPVSPGHIPGVLASFTVEPQTSQPVAGNLGVLWPSPQAQVSQFATIPPGQEFVSRVVVPVAGLYTLETTFTQGSVAISRAGPDGVAVIDPASTGPSNTYEMPLKAGVYIVSFRTVGTQPAVGQWTFQFSSIDYEWILDNGVGIAPHRLNDIFRPFVSSKGARGTGLGLALCRSIVEQHGGRIWAESTPGAGSRFLFTLPRGNNQL